MRIVNRERLKRFLLEKGTGAKEILAVKAKCSASLIEKLISGKIVNAPREATQFKIAQYTGIPQDELFPEVEEAPTKRTASR